MHPREASSSHQCEKSPVWSHVSGCHTALVSIPLTQMGSLWAGLDFSVSLYDCPLGKLFSRRRCGMCHCPYFPRLSLQSKYQNLKDKFSLVRLRLWGIMSCTGFCVSRILHHDHQGGHGTGCPLLGKDGSLAGSFYTVDKTVRRARVDQEGAHGPANCLQRADSKHTR